MSVWPNRQFNFVAYRIGFNHRRHAQTKRSKGCNARESARDTDFGCWSRVNLRQPHTHKKPHNIIWYGMMMPFRARHSSSSSTYAIGFYMYAVSRVLCCDLKYTHKNRTCVVRVPVRCVCVKMSVVHEFCVNVDSAVCRGRIYVRLWCAPRGV